MVLLAAGICTKGGKALVSRQFVEMTRARIEGLLAAFPKLLSSDKSGAARQHTFVETESVRYVYQPMEALYVVLITTKASNILEDLETLRLFSRVIPEYCRTTDEKEVVEQAFQLIFAFDEIIALGYRENVNLAQIRTFTEMDSHEERVFYQIKKTQEEEAKKLAKDRAREITKSRQAAELGARGGRGGRGMGAYADGGGMGGGGGMGVGSMGGGGGSVPEKPAYQPPSREPRYPAAFREENSRPTGPSNALKLGKKKQDEDAFLSQLQSEGQAVVTTARSKASAASAAPAPAVPAEPVHLRTEEKLSLVMSRDGGLESMEVHGLVTLRVADGAFDKIRIQMANNDARGAQTQTHPNLDKKAWQSSASLQLKSVGGKPFPLNTDVGVLKWRFQTTDESFVPLSINCWPNESGSGVEVNIEYTLELEDLELRDVLITVPLPSGASPNIASCDGEYKVGRSQLEWKLPLIDASNASGSLDFSTPTGHSDDFFPLKIQFSSPKLFSDITPVEVKSAEDAPVKFSQEAAFFTEKYDVV